MPYVTQLERDAIERGLQQGLQQGHQEGRLEGELRLLKRLLVRRFGPLPAWAEQRLEQASPLELGQWAERVLEAGALEAVFQASA